VSTMLNKCTKSNFPHDPASKLAALSGMSMVHGIASGQVRVNRMGKSKGKGELRRERGIKEERQNCFRSRTALKPHLACNASCDTAV